MDFREQIKGLMKCREKLNLYLDMDRDCIHCKAKSCDIW